MAATARPRVRAQAADDGRRLGTMLRHGMLSPRGYGPLYAFEIALAPRCCATCRRSSTWSRSRPTSRCSARARSTWSPSRRSSPCWPRPRSARFVPLRPFRIAHYYVAVTAASAAGLWDYLRRGVPRHLGEGGGHAVSGRGLPRVADLALAALGLAALGAPLRSPVAAIAIKLDSRGPVIYRQQRVGREGAGVRASTSSGRCGWAPTRLAWGRRSWRTIRASRGSAASCGGSRSTRSRTWSTCCAGRWRSSGPGRRWRRRWSSTRRSQRRRLEVKPGLTGWAQVNGRAGIPWEERIELDVWYVDHRSPAPRPADPRAAPSAC